MIVVLCIIAGFAIGVYVGAELISGDLYSKCRISTTEYDNYCKFKTLLKMLCG